MISRYFILLIPILLLTPTLAFGMKNLSPSEQGYYYGVLDGKASANDPSPVCGGYNSAADANECDHTYDLGFKKGCEEIGYRYHDPSPEYPTCADAGWIPVKNNNKHVIVYTTICLSCVALGITRNEISIIFFDYDIGKFTIYYLTSTR